MFRRSRHLGWIAPMSFGLALSLQSADARACGGLFCSTANPVNQAAERIVFAHDESAGRVTAVIEILYQGPADQFAWILPVSGTPDVSVSTNALLNRLQQATNPVYQLQRTWPEDTCNADFDSGGNSVPGADDNADGEGGSVSVLASGNAGPYDYEVISVAAGAEDPAQDAIEWLMTNGYDTGATGPDLLRPYLVNGLNLLAVRLSKQASVGSIRPIKLAYDSDEPMIPIRPTAVAANDDMGILVWVLGSARAVPLNYKTLELNEALIDWFNPQQSYNDVVIAAANETGDGQGFVTELAGPTSDPNNGDISQRLFNERFTIQDFRQTADSLNNAELIVDVVDRFNAFDNFNFTGPFGGATSSGQVALDGVADALSQNHMLPMGVTIDQFMATPRCYLEQFQVPDAFYCEGRPAPEVGVSLVGFDRSAFLTDVEELVIQPIEETVALFADFPYMTRFYTTLSADEMSVDPGFTINSDLSDVTNFHSVDLEYGGCFGDTSGPWQVRFGERVVRGEGNTWPLTLATRSEDMPVNRRILQLSASGAGEVYLDNDDAIAQLLDAPMDMSMPPSGNGGGSGMTGSGMMPQTPSGNDPMTLTPVRMGSSGGCSLGSTSPASGFASAAAALLGLALLGGCRRRG